MTSAPQGPPRPGEPPKPADTDAPSCDLCEGPMLDRHCKLVCLHCGYQRDCSDP